MRFLKSMDKSYGEKKIKFANKNKYNKKQKYSNHRNKFLLHKPVRNYVNSHINHIIQNKNLLNEFNYLLHSSDIAINKIFSKILFFAL